MTRDQIESRGGTRALTRRVPTAAVIPLGLVALALVLFSPLALVLLDDAVEADWSKLSAIGETYGAVSALLSALALGGVVIALRLQSREVRLSQEQAVRTFHHDLLMKAMDDPLYLRCWGSGRADSDDTHRQTMYVNLMLSFWQMAYQMGALHEPGLRADLDALFESEAGRRFWATWGDTRRATGEGTRYDKYHQIVEEQFQAAIASGPPLVTAPSPGAPSGRRSHHPATVATVGVAVGLLLHGPLQRLLRR